MNATDAAGNAGSGAGSAIYGSTGRDDITSGPGNELLSGGRGADKFVFSNSHFGKDVITDFGVSGATHDVMEFIKSVFSGYSSVMAQASQVGANVAIQHDAADTPGPLQQGGFERVVLCHQDAQPFYHRGTFRGGYAYFTLASRRLDHVDAHAASVLPRRSGRRS